MKQVSHLRGLNYYPGRLEMKIKDLIYYGLKESYKVA